MILRFQIGLVGNIPTDSKFNTRLIYTRMKEEGKKLNMNEIQHHNYYTTTLPELWLSFWNRCWVQVLTLSIHRKKILQSQKNKANFSPRAEYIYTTEKNHL